MAQKTFEATSDQGNFSEALAAAIAAGLEAVQPEILFWKLDSVKGERGGITNANKITVTISV